MNDVVRLRDFIAKENPNAAKKAAKAIQDAAQRLIATPSIGKPVMDLHPFRDLLIRFGVGGYILRYRVSEETIHIVHIRMQEADFKC